MIRSYHMPDTETGDAMALELAENVCAAIPTAVRSMIGTHSVYRINIKGIDYRCTWRELLAKGSYNHVYYCDLTNVTNSNQITPAVIKVTMQGDDLRVYLMENVLHAILYTIPQTSSLVVPIRFLRNSPFWLHPSIRLPLSRTTPAEGTWETG